MKLVMVNDCAYVGETLIKYLPFNIETMHLKRSRGFWDKTVGIAWNIFGAKADVFHTHYLLQDCYLALRFGKKPIVGHAHGSDLRNSLKHAVWGRIVRYNLKNCDKILVSTPDVLGQAKTFRDDAEYFPNPVDTKLFYSISLAKHGGKKHVLIASDSNWAVKGTDVAVRALARIKEDVNVNIIEHGIDFDKTMTLASSLGLHLNVLPKVPHEKINQYYWNADVVIERFKLGSLGMVSLEAIACGRPVVTYVSSEYPEYKDFPLKDVDTEEKIVNAISHVSFKLWETQYAYLKKNHKVEGAVQRLLSTYEAICEQ